MRESGSRAAEPHAWEVLDALPQSSIVVDADWTVRWIDTPLAERIGVPVATVVGRPLWDALRDGLQGEVGEHFRQVMRDRRPVHFEFPGSLTRRWNRVDIRPLTGGGLLVLVEDVTETRATRRNEARLLAEHALLARVADAIARNVEPASVFELVCQEMATLFDVEYAGVGRTAGPGRCEVVASWSATHGPGVGRGLYDLRAEDEFERLRRDDAPIWSRVSDGTMSHWFRPLSLAVTHAVPIRVDGRLWGLLMTGAQEESRLDEETARRQQDLCDLLGVAIADAQSREELILRATTDSLTGLTNHRTFHEQLDAAVTNAAAAGSALSVAVLDVDAFRSVNEALGHAAGDRLLVAAAEALRRATRPGDVVARLGGDEFGLILPGLDRDRAHWLVDTARRAMAQAATAVITAPASVSAGICDVAETPEPGRVLELADGALYWAKGHGRDATCVFDSAIVRELNARERVASLERSRVLLGISALARAIDAKDAATRRHAERVARLAVGVAREMLLAAPVVDRLEQAALVHDVGKIGVPDSILLKPGSLDPDELEQMREHAALGARMVEGVLDADQVRWIRSHHERPDGNGYPDGLGAADLDAETGILSLCDAWDVMLSGRPYQAARSAQSVMAECEALVDRQFLPAPVGVLRAMLDGGRLDALL